jgi:HemY protein
VSLAAGYNEGYVLLVLPPWRVELSLNFFIVLLLCALVAAYATLRAVTITLRLPQAVRDYRARTRRTRATRALREAVQQLFEGRYGHALKNAALSYGVGEAPGLSALVAARAAHALRDALRTKQWLKRAAEHDAEAHNARLMTEAELAVDAHRYDVAVQALDALHERGGRHAAALRLGLRAHSALGRWNDVLKAARQLEKHRGLTHEAAAPLKMRAHQENLIGIGGDARALAAYWKALPADERRIPRLATTAASALMAAGDGASAQRIIEGQLDSAWDSELAELYGDRRGEDTLARIARAEKWLEKQPGDARLLLALGRLCREQELWGKAQSYFEASIALLPSQHAYAELAALLDQLGKSEEANRVYRLAAELCERGTELAARVRS